MDDEVFKCSFQFTHTKYDVDLKRSNIFCSTDESFRAQRLFLLAPSGYRFTALIDVNPTRFRKIKVAGICLENIYKNDNL